jgi:glycosyltransferase involved in cell wall biosynthesis
MAVHIFHVAVLALSWLIALFWAGRVLTALRNLPSVPDLCCPGWETEAGAAVASLCVVVPACNEEASIAATLRSLLGSEGVPLEIIAVDDRSIDRTGEIMDEVAHFASVAAGSKGAPTLRVLHITELPEGWLGKPHAMALAARQSTAEWLLFTDGDVIFSPDALRRAMQFMAAESADHLVIFPTLILKQFGERMIVSCLHVLSVCLARPWKVADPKARRESTGIGAFSLVRREAYAGVGGFESLRMEVIDDVRFGHKIKQAGYRQRVAFGRGLVSLRWAVGAGGVVRNLTKNAFAAARFRVMTMLAACCGFAMLMLLPFLCPLLAVGTLGLRLGLCWRNLGPALVVLAALWVIARYYRRYSDISPAYVLVFPVAACLCLYAAFRSMAVTLRNGGVSWRGTLYSLSELRKHAGPLR